MTLTRLNYLAGRWTSHTDLDDYKAYLRQLAEDNRDSGTDATAEDYETMLALLSAIEREVEA